MRCAEVLFIRQFVNEPLHSLGGHLGAHVPIKGRGRATLLHMTKNIDPRGEVFLTLLRIFHNLPAHDLLRRKRSLEALVWSTF